MTTIACPLPTIIQGGMGIGMSSWSLARAGSLRGQLDVVAGTAIDSRFVRRLQRAALPCSAAQVDRSNPARGSD